MEHYPDSKMFEAEFLSCLTNSYLSAFLNMDCQIRFLWRWSLKRRFIKLSAEFLTGFKNASPIVILMFSCMLVLGSVGAVSLAGKVHSLISGFH